jgi:predicted neutral ceramidase superfamily lipid hydrolase
MNIGNKLYDNDLQGNSESSQYQLKSYFIQYVILLIVCLVVIGLIIRSNYLDEAERGNTSEKIILAVASILVAYRLYVYVF